MQSHAELTFRVANYNYQLQVYSGNILYMIVQCGYISWLPTKKRYCSYVAIATFYLHCLQNVPWLCV